MGINVSRDMEGYLINQNDWNEKIAIQLADEENIDLNDEHWTVLKIMREYYTEHGVAPDVRHVVASLVTEQNYEKKEAKKHIFKLFPYGYVKQACKISGMKQPRAWSTG